LLKEERHRRLLEILGAEGRLVASELGDRLGVSGYTVRRDLEELSEAGHLQRVHGGAVARSRVGGTYDERRGQEVAGKRAVARAAVTLLQPGGVHILDGGTTALALVDELPPAFTATFVTHSPLVAAALAPRPDVEVVQLGGIVDRRAMVAVGAETIRGYERVSADVCFLGIWSLSVGGGIAGRYPEEAEVRRVMVGRADRVVGLCSADKLNTAAAFASAPATALTHIATEDGVPDAALQPFRELGIEVVTPA
jgi:DeoR/GlpR family transcriptional regulator of sugar metabolism